jgi:hypothetical protein
MHETDERKAQKFLQRRLGEISTGSFIAPATERIRVSELADDMFRDYRINVRRSLKLTEQRWNKHLRDVFGSLRTIEVNTEAVNRYVDKRRADGAQNGQP